MEAPPSMLESQAAPVQAEPEPLPEAAQVEAKPLEETNKTTAEALFETPQSPVEPAVASEAVTEDLQTPLALQEEPSATTEEIAAPLAEALLPQVEIPQMETQVPAIEEISAPVEEEKIAPPAPEPVITKKSKKQRVGGPPISLLLMFTPLNALELTQFLRSYHSSP